MLSSDTRLLMILPRLITVSSGHISSDISFAVGYSFTNFNLIFRPIRLSASRTTLPSHGPDLKTVMGPLGLCRN